MYHFPMTLCLLLLFVGCTIWWLYAVCSHTLLVQLVMCHQSAQIYLDVGHYSENEVRLWRQNYILAQNESEWDPLFAVALIQNPSQSVCLSLSLLSLCLRRLLLPLSFCVSPVHTSTNTHLCLLKERGRGGERRLENTPQRWHHLLSCSALFFSSGCLLMIRFQAAEATIIHPSCSVFSA